MAVCIQVVGFDPVSNGPIFSILRDESLQPLTHDQCPSGEVWAMSGEVISGGITDLSPADGALISGAILVVWAVGWAFRKIAQILNVADEEIQK